MTSEERGRAYVPALRFPALTRAYDATIRVLFSEAALRTQLIEQARLEAGHHVLDLGCGTGSLLIAVKQAFPSIKAVGLDADPQALAIARQKAVAAGVDIGLVEGFSVAPRLPRTSFDRVLSSLFFHHLNRGDKHLTLAAARQLLKDGGEIHVLDWGRPHGLMMRTLVLGVQVLDGLDGTADNVAGRLPEFMEEAGFRDVAEVRRRRSLLGTLSYYRGVKAT